MPSFDLSISAGYTALTDFIGSLPARVIAPLFTGGALEGQLEIATADQMATIAVDGQSVLTAFMEVKNSLVNERIFTRRLALLEKVVDDNQRAYQLAVKQYEVGQIEVLNML